jgi:serine/threonine protein kinase
MLGPDGVRVVDFGAAVPMADVGPQHRRSYQGTTGYVALERCLGAAPTARMDVFSLGALTYRALIGIRPYADSRSLQVTRRLSPKSLKQPVLIRPGIGPFISDLLLRTLALDPSKRPASPREFAEEFAMGMPRTRVR